MENYRAKIPFRYDIVGSFLRPERLKEARAAFADGAISREELTRVEDEEIRTLIEQQKKAGLKAVTDGEFRRRWWHLDFLSYLNGITVYDFESSAFGVTAKMQNTYLSAPLSWNPEHPFLGHFRFTREAAGDEVLAKQTIPGPNMIYLDSVMLAKQYQEHPVYADHDAFVRDLAETYRQAIRAFYDAGCRYLQLDDTSWGALFSDRFRQRLSDLGHDPDQLIQEFGDITELALEGRPEDMAITMHMCKGNFMSHALYAGTYDKIAKRLLAIENLDGFFLEYDDERSGSFEPLQNIRGQKVVLGLVTTKTDVMEDKEFIKSRIRGAAQYVPLEQLCLSPQCGFSSTQEGNHIPEEFQWAKLRLIKEIADEVWGEN